MPHKHPTYGWTLDRLHLANSIVHLAQDLSERWTWNRELWGQRALRTESSAIQFSQLGECQLVFRLCQVVYLPSELMC